MESGATLSQSWENVSAILQFGRQTEGILRKTRVLSNPDRRDRAKLPLRPRPIEIRKRELLATLSHGRRARCAPIIFIPVLSSLAAGFRVTQPVRSSLDHQAGEDRRKLSC